MRRFVHPPLQRLDVFVELIDLGLELRDLLGLALDGVLDGRRGELPCQLVKGKGPQDGVGMRVRRRRLEHPGSRQCGVSSVSLIGRNVKKLERGRLIHTLWPPL